MPERMGNTNRWQLFANEYVAGRVATEPGIIKGPTFVTVSEYPELNMMRVRGPEKSLELDGVDFPSKVRTIRPQP